MVLKDPSITDIANSRNVLARDNRKDIYNKDVKIQISFQNGEYSAADVAEP